jgi:hypothetical protein
VRLEKDSFRMFVPRLMLRFAARHMNTPSATSPPLCVTGEGGCVGARGEGGGAPIGALRFNAQPRGGVRCPPQAALAARLQRRCTGSGAFAF